MRERGDIYWSTSALCVGVSVRPGVTDSFPKQSSVLLLSLSSDSFSVL